MPKYDSDNPHEDAVFSDLYPRLALIIYLTVVCIGIGVAVFVAYMGFRGWEPVFSILLGGFLISIARIFKRWMRSVLWREGADQDDRVSLAQNNSAIDHPRPPPTSVMAFALIAVLMGIVACFWYLLGSGLRWLFT